MLLPCTIRKSLRHRYYLTYVNGDCNFAAIPLNCVFTKLHRVKGNTYANDFEIINFLFNRKYAYL